MADPKRCAVGLLSRSQSGIMLPRYMTGVGFALSSAPPEKGRGMTTRRTLHLPELLVAAAMLMACAATVLAASEKEKKAFLGKNGKISYGSHDGATHETYTINPQITNNKTDGLDKR